jgi:hypothetical protein
MISARSQSDSVVQEGQALFTPSYKVRATGLATLRAIAREALVVMKSWKMPATRSPCACLLRERPGMRRCVNPIWPVLWVIVCILAVFFLRN